MTVVTVALIAFCGLSAGALWWAVSRFGEDRGLARTPVSMATFAGIPGLLLLLAALAGLSTGAATGPLLVVAVVATAVTTVTGGGLVATAVLRLADPTFERTPAEPAPAQGEVLRGGAWIGVLERLAILAALLAGWYEGVAVALGLKGLGRYPELRRSEASERFIIGTFASILWVVATYAVFVTIR